MYDNKNLKTKTVKLPILSNKNSTTTTTTLLLPLLLLIKKMYVEKILQQKNEKNPCMTIKI